MPISVHAGSTAADMMVGKNLFSELRKATVIGDDLYINNWQSF